MRKFLLAIAFFSVAACAEKSTLVISKQYGLGYLPLIVAEEHKLIEKRAKAAGLGDIKVEWATFGGGSTANDALLSGSADLVSGGVAPFVRLWDKTNGKVKALLTLNEAPVVFVSNNPKVKTLRDLTDKDRIALPAVKVSIQALVLQIATAKEFGVKNYDKFDRLTVALKHPDAYAALSSETEITGHIGLEPYSDLELLNKKNHKVFSSYDIFGAPHSANLVWTSEDFYTKNPKLAKAIVDAINEADEWISTHKIEAAELYLTSAKSKEPKDLIEKIVKEGVYRSKPTENITVFSDFLFETGAIKSKPKNWRELFFDAVGK
ncbi:MAG: ABC transporter substrate-binding protein [Helicobacteraceae bacterium]|jgi:NitT/TauT family transport system substrate-binding protein|nr:ABC transporter substrate-binding protein [Helicobacteraceae bacterium]